MRKFKILKYLQCQWERSAKMIADTQCDAFYTVGTEKSTVEGQKTRLILIGMGNRMKTIS